MYSEDHEDSYIYYKARRANAENVDLVVSQQGRGGRRYLHGVYCGSTGPADIRSMASLYGGSLLAARKNTVKGCPVDFFASFCT